MTAIQNGDKVKIHYRGTLESGEEFDNSAGREPLEFTAGGEELIPGMSNAVIGMSVGDKKTVTLPPAEAYGERNEEMLLRVEPGQLPEGVDWVVMVGGGLLPSFASRTRAN